MARYLFIVSKKRPELREYLLGHFSLEEEVQVMIDRRRGERRRSHLDTGTQRR